MNRDRPNELPRALPDVRRRQHKEREERRREELKRLKAFSGPGFMGYLGATFSRGKLSRGPQFIRPGYESGIVDDLREFYERRPRPWRPACMAPKVNRKTLPRTIGRRAMHRRHEANAAR